MYASLLEWCKFPVNVHAFVSKSGTGDNTYAEPVAYKGYRVDDTAKIVDKYGTEYVSRSRVYFPPEVPIKEVDMISFPDDTAKREIRKLGGCYDGNDGKRSIWVVYL